MRSFNASNIPHASSNPLHRAGGNDSDHPVLEDFLRSAGMMFNAEREDHAQPALQDFLGDVGWVR